MPKGNRQKVTALIITYNEMGYIEKCIDSVRFADEIIVVDSHSTDGTFEYLSADRDVQVLQHPFENFTQQKSFALKQATHDWVLFLDADEIVTDALQEEILQLLATGSPHAAIMFRRQFMFKNRPLRFSGWQTDKNYRLFRKSRARFSDRKLVHETLEVEGSSGIFANRLVHYCYKEYDNYKQKMRHYGRLKARQDFYRESPFNYLKLLAKPGWKFVHHYFIRLGFLDGRKGLTICYLNALSEWERCLELKKLEAKNQLPYCLLMPK